jgi:hypothetical protein
LQFKSLTDMVSDLTNHSQNNKNLSLKGISIKTLIIFFPVKNNWLPLFNWNIVESDVKRHNPNP